MQKISADIIFTGTGEVLKEKVLIADDDGMILDILPAKNFSSGDVRFFKGALCPGFVNAHCHLELSYLKGIIPEKTGLDRFLNAVENFRKKESAGEINTSMKNAIEEMKQGGIVAVGDICNTNASFPLKENSETMPDGHEGLSEGALRDLRSRQVYFHTFIEQFGLLPERSEERFLKAISLFHECPLPSKSLTPHTVYAVSKPLLDEILQYAEEENHIISVHMLESAAERELFEQGTGNFLERYKEWGMDISFWKAPRISPLKFLLDRMKKNSTLILVHNTFMIEDEIRWAMNEFSNVPYGDAEIYFCLCPNANLYIENTLPDIPAFIRNDAKIILGTDSLASNHQLSIPEEMRSIQKRFPEISLAQMIPWATSNGVKALRINKKLGMLEKGKCPGIVHLSDTDGNFISGQTRAERIL